MPIVQHFKPIDVFYSDFKDVTGLTIDAVIVW